MKKWLPFALLVLSNCAWFISYRSLAHHKTVEPGLIVMGDPLHYPDSVRIYKAWFMDGYSTHCLVIDNVKREVRPFYEHSWCRSEANEEIRRAESAFRPTFPPAQNAKP